MRGAEGGGNSHFLGAPQRAGKVGPCLWRLVPAVVHLVVVLLLLLHSLGGT